MDAIALATALFRSDWQISGVEPNLVMLQTLRDKLATQGLMDQPLDASVICAEFSEAATDPRSRLPDLRLYVPDAILVAWR